MTPLRTAPVLGALALLALVTSPVARAEDDLLASIYTDNGFEVRRDERLFTLFSALNSAGYVRGVTARELPFPRWEHHPIRERLRKALSAADEGLRKPVDVFLDTHPVSLERYVEFTLQLGDSPAFKPPKTLAKDLAGLEKVLAEYARTAKTDKLLRALATDYRAVLKRVADAADKPFLDLRAAYRLSEEEAPSLVLMPNPLDAGDAALARRIDEDTHVLVLGVPPPERALDLGPALRAYSALLASEQAKDVTVAGLDAALAELKSAGLAKADVSATDLVRDSLQAAVEAKLFARDSAAAVQAAFAKGLLLTKTYFEALAEPAEAFPAEKGSFAVQAAAKLDAKKALGELLKARK